MKLDIIKSDLEVLLDNLKKSSTNTQEASAISQFDFDGMFKELEHVIEDYRKEHLQKAIDSEKELSKSILTY